MTSPLEPQDDNWWDVEVNRREKIWLALSSLWGLTLFGWMAGWTKVGEQNPVGETTRVSTTEFRERVQGYRDEARQTDRGIVPPDDDVYVGAFRFGWDGLPAVLEAGTEYTFRLGSYDVQHGLSIRKEDALSKQMSLQMLPGYEWAVPMTFDETGTYHVICNEFCGFGHRTMHGTFEVVEDAGAVPSNDGADDTTAGTGAGDGADDGDGTGGTAADGGGA
jgi:cytochrome c oxidase subunit 2